VCKNINRKYKDLSENFVYGVGILFSLKKRGVEKIFNFAHIFCTKHTLTSTNLHVRQKSFLFIVKGARTLEDVNDKKSFARKIRSRSMLLGDGTQKTCPAVCRMRAKSKVGPCSKEMVRKRRILAECRYAQIQKSIRA
jgi:hypothetical protein